MVSKRLGETTSNSGFVLCFNNVAPCDHAQVFVVPVLPPVHALLCSAVYVCGCAYYAQCYSAISHRASVIQLDLECELFLCVRIQTA